MSRKEFDCDVCILDNSNASRLRADQSYDFLLLSSTPSNNGSDSIIMMRIDGKQAVLVSILLHTTIIVIYRPLSSFADDVFLTYTAADRRS
jgi:hypothetical protein